MHIFIDESGTFAHSPNEGSWDVVAALTVPEVAKRHLEAEIAKLKRKLKVSPNDELKANKVPENDLIFFIRNLAQHNVLFFCVATNSHKNDADSLMAHKRDQVDNIRSKISGMIYPEGKKAVSLLADQIDALSLQQYIQLQCHILLLEEIFHRAMTFYVQRHKSTLSSFRWRIDQKGVKMGNYESALIKLAPAIMQTMGFSRPFEFVSGFDYRHMKKYCVPNSEVPEYLKEALGSYPGESLDLQKILKGDIEFVDSKKSAGIQAVDFLASGIRRCLRNKYDSPRDVANALGHLIVQNRKNEMPICLIAFKGVQKTDRFLASILGALSENNREMFVHREGI